MTTITFTVAFLLGTWFGIILWLTWNTVVLRYQRKAAWYHADSERRVEESRRAIEEARK